MACQGCVIWNRRARIRRRRGTLEAKARPEDEEKDEEHISSAALAKTAASDPSIPPGPRSGPQSAPEWTSSRPAPVIVSEREDAESGPDPMIGRVLSGLYKVQDRIGEGGMGTVYMALHIHLNKPFAVKVLSEKVAANKTAVDRLLQEAQAASSIDHDNIVDVVSFDATDDGRVFLVMELLKGTSLGELVDRGPMRLERALPIVYQLCQALGAAHERGIVHRDLKPDNVFIVRKAEADFVKVLDFGISKVKSAEAEQVRMTKTGQLVGTPLYMSPEQAKGEADVDHRADIYALGVMLYEMVAGKPPFEGGNYFQLLWKHGNETPPPPTTYQPSLPEGVSAAIMRSLEKSPAARFQSMAAFEAALHAAAPEIGPAPARLVSLPPGIVAPLPRPKPIWPAVVGALALIAAIVAGSYWARGEQAVTPVPPPEVVAEVPEGVPEVVEPEVIPPGEDVPVRVAVRFESEPAGAEVMRLDDDSVIGTTPFSTDLEIGAEVPVRFSLRGHRTAEEIAVGTEGQVVEASLRPIRRRDPIDDSDSPLMGML